jgi:uncharacterized protein YoxC
MIVEISLLVIAVFIVIFVIALLIVLVQVKRTAQEVEKFFDTARQHIAPMTHDATLILNDTRKIVQSIERQIGSIETGVHALRDTAESIRHFEADLEDQLEQPLQEITTFITAIGKMLRGLLGLLGRKNGLS